MSVLRPAHWEPIYLWKLEGSEFQYGLFLFCRECSWFPVLFLINNRSSMLLSPWLPGHRAKWLRTTWMSSKTSGKSRSECWQRLWMISPQWMTFFPSQVITTNICFHKSGERDKGVAYKYHCPVLQLVFLAICSFSHFYNCNYNTKLKNSVFGKLVVSRHCNKNIEARR